ncbi:MAG TPA: divalent-cation tolerance protein CutA [Blastocatellia bacterium]
MRNELVVFVTAPTVEEGTRISEILVTEKLAACVNLVAGVRSIYTWEEKICSEAEVLLIIKTTEVAYAALELRVKQLHSYSVPEVIALRIERGSEQYLSWLAQGATPIRKS